VVQEKGLPNEEGMISNKPAIVVGDRETFFVAIPQYPLILSGIQVAE
jgi:hypothetical protein